MLERKRSIKVDLHDIFIVSETESFQHGHKIDARSAYFSEGRELERTLAEVMTEAVERKADLVAIIPGKGSGQLRLRNLDKISESNPAVQKKSLRNFF